MEVTLDGRIVAERRRVWARHVTVTDPAHVTTASQLREQFSRPTTGEGDPLFPDLADYHQAFGLDSTEVA